MSVAFLEKMNPELQKGFREAQEENEGAGAIEAIAKNALPQIEPKRKKIIPLKQLTQAALAKERERALSLFFREDKPNLSDSERQTLLRHKQEFQRSLEDAWKHFDFWIKGFGEREEDADLSQGCLFVNLERAAKAAWLIRECFPALYYYCLPEDINEVNRFVCSCLSGRPLSFDEMEAIGSMLISLPLNAPSFKESGEAHHLLFSQPGISTMQEAAQGYIDQFVQEFIEEGNFTLEFQGVALSGGSCEERILSLVPFFNHVRQSLRKMMQEGDRAFFQNIEERYPFDPGLVHHEKLNEIAEIMKSDRTFLETSLGALPQPEEKLAVFPLKMAWLIVSAAVSNYFVAKKNIEQKLQQPKGSPPAIRQQIKLKSVEMILHDDLNGMTVRAEGLGHGGRERGSGFKLHQGYQKEALFLQGEKELHEEGLRDGFKPYYSVTFSMNQMMLDILSFFGGADTTERGFFQAGALEKLTVFLEILSSFKRKGLNAAESPLEEKMRSDLALAGFIVPAEGDANLYFLQWGRVLSEGAERAAELVLFLDQLKGGFRQGRELRERINLALRDAVEGIHILKRLMDREGVKTDGKEWLEMVDIVELKLKPIFSTDKESLLAIPRNPRTYAETVLDVIYQSERQEDIDWKCQRYRDMLKQLMDRCQLLCPEEAASIFEDRSILFPKEGLTRKFLDILRAGFTETFLQTLRSKLTDDALFASPKKNPYCRISEILFTEMNLDDAAQSMLKKFIGWGASLTGLKAFDLEEGSNTSLVSGFDTAWRCLQAVPLSAKRPPLHQIASSMRGRWNVDFDPIRQGNLPHVLGKIRIVSASEVREVKALALGSPTIEGTLAYATLSPEFKGWMASYQSEGKSHLFVLNQNQIPSWRILGEVETDRIGAVTRFAEETVPDALYVCVLSKNSPFYFQSGEFAALFSAQEFKSQFLQQLFNLPKSQTGNSFSTNLLKKIPGLEPWTESMIDALHQSLFSNQVSLSKEERLLFIDAAHSLLILFLIKELGVSSFNISCKDAIDRAVVSIAHLLALISLLSNQNRDLEFRRKFFMVVFARALMVRKRPIFFDRLERIISSVQGFESKSECLIQSARSLLGEVGFSFLA